MMLITLLYAHGHGCMYGLSCRLVDQGICISMVYNVCCGPCSVTCEVCNVCYLIYELFFLYLYFYAMLVYIKWLFGLQKKEEKLS